jgi:PPOX class probable F420-dependent enzyme
MTTLTEAVAIGAQERYLCVVATVRADGTIQSSVVNAGAMAHPVTGEEVLAFVTYGQAKLANLRARPQINVTFRAGGAWAAVEGTASIVGPDDPLASFDSEGFRLLLRAVFVAAGGTHDDWDAYDRVMVETRRAAVFVTPTRIYSNGGR